TRRCGVWLLFGIAPTLLGPAGWRSIAASLCRAVAGQPAASPSAEHPTPLGGQRNQSSCVPAYAALSFRLARLALMSLIVSTSPDLLCVYATISTRPDADRPRRRNLCSRIECRTSGPSNPIGSANTVAASSNETPCLARLARAFASSHSNT